MKTIVCTLFLSIQLALNAQFGFVKEFPTELGIFHSATSANQIFEQENNYQIYIDQGSAFSYYDSSTVNKFSIDKTNGEITKRFIHNEAESCHNTMSAIKFNNSSTTNLEYGAWFGYGDTCGNFIPSPKNTKAYGHYFSIDEENEMYNLFTKKDLIDILPDSLDIETEEDVKYLHLMGQDLDSNYLVHLTRNGFSEKASVIYSINIKDFKIKWILEINAAEYPHRSIVTEQGYYLNYENAIVTITREGKLNKALFRETGWSYKLLTDDSGNLVVSMNERDFDAQDYILNPVVYSFDLDTISTFNLRNKKGGRFLEHKNDIWKFSSGHEFGAYTSDGELIWKKHIGEIVECREEISLDYACWVNNIIATNDGGFLLVVKKVPSYILVKTDCLGNVEWKSDNCYVGHTDNFEIYPNPVYDNITIHFEKEIESDKIELIIHDINGKQIKKLYQYNDTSTLHFDVSDLLEGLYLYQFIYKGELKKTDKFLKL